jgi:segregation and condensation protein B
MEIKDIECMAEGILFASGEPVGIDRLCVALEIDKKTLESVIGALADRFAFERRGIRIVRMDNSYQMCSAPEYGDIIRKVMETRKPPSLSQSALEVLSIVAFYQPVTRSYVDQVRGVDSSYTMGMLLDRELIEECGKLDVPGRPTLFRTTKDFLRTFGISSLSELPDLPQLAGEQDGQMSMADTEIAAGAEEEL